MQKVIHNQLTYDRVDSHEAGGLKYEYPDGNRDHDVDRTNY